MAEFKNRVPSESDGLLRYSAVDRGGRTVLADVTLKPVSPLLSAGTPWTAACANKLLTLDANNVPVLTLDGGTY